MTARILVFCFEGVIGDFYSPCVWQQTDTIPLYLRPGAVATLEGLCRTSQIVVLFTSPSERAEFVLRYLAKMGVRVDAAYWVSQGAWSVRPFSYEQIYIDFEVTEQVLSRVIVIGSYTCEHLTKEQLLRNSSVLTQVSEEVSRAIPFILPRSQCKTVPATILMRDAKLSPSLKVSPLNILEPVLSRLEDGWDALRPGRASGWLAVESDAIFEVAADREEKLRRLGEQRNVAAISTMPTAEFAMDPETKVRYTELAICNDDIRGNIQRYWQDHILPRKVEERIPDLDLTRPVTHRLVIMREARTVLMKYAPVASAPRAAPRKFC